MKCIKFRGPHKQYKIHSLQLLNSISPLLLLEFFFLIFYPQISTLKHFSKNNNNKNKIRKKKIANSGKITGSYMTTRQRGERGQDRQ